MKYAFLIIFWMSWAHGSTPLIVKTNSPGYVLPEYWFEETCKLFRDRVEIEYRLAGQAVTETRRVSGTSMIEKLIQKAKQEKLSEVPNLICDGPSTVISGRDQVLLYSTGGCGSPKQVREGGAAFLLTSLINKYCTVTH